MMKFILTIVLIIMVSVKSLKTSVRFSIVRRQCSSMNMVDVKDDVSPHFMQLAIRHAQFSFREKEVPIGAVLVDGNNEVLVASRNRVETDQDATMHAEIDCIRKASKLRKNWRLSDCTLYTTLEPCPMCLGAIQAARIKKVVYGAPALKSDTSEVQRDYTSLTQYAFEIQGGVMEAECSTLLKQFFRQRRQESEEYEESNEQLNDKTNINIPQAS